MYYLVRETKRNLAKWQHKKRHIEKKFSSIEKLNAYFEKWIKNCKFCNLLAKYKYSIYTGNWKLIEELN